MPTDELSQVFGALADPTRRDILTRLRVGPATAGELASQYSMSRSAVSQHLSVLDRAGLITRTANAQWRECAIREAGLNEAADWVEQHRADWSQRFDLLERHLRDKKDTP